jgi:PhzF family phenazine biosynthesis protein
VGAVLLGVDAFTSEPFRGNPAAVCLLDGDAAPTEEWMQALAAEMNLSETAFVTPRGADRFDLRWFTPTVEAQLCGHATLASAHALWETGVLGLDATARFATRWYGELRAQRRGAEIALDFPSFSTAAAPEPPGLAAALGTVIGTVHATALGQCLVELPDADSVRALQPDFAALGALDVGPVVVTAGSDDARFDFVSRCFAPGYGIDEDPVTGSAHCALGPWWSARLAKVDLVGYQASARGGVVRVLVDGSDRATLLGAAVTVWSGTLSA